MISIRKIKPKWLAKVRLKGLSTSKIFATKMEAKSWAIQQDHQHGKHGGVVRGKILSDALEKYVLEISPRKKSCRSEKFRIKSIQRHEISSILLINLHREDIENWIACHTRYIYSVVCQIAYHIFGSLKTRIQGSIFIAHVKISFLPLFIINLN